MSKVKIGFSGLTVPEQIERGRNIYSKMLDNANYTSPIPTLVVYNGSVVSLETAFNESRGRDKNKVAAMKLRRKEFLFLSNQLGAYVQEASGGDEEKIRSSGYDVVKPRAPHSDTAGAVSNVRLSDGSNNGKIRVDFDKADNAVLYAIVVSIDADFSKLEPKGITTKTHKEIGDFDPGTRIWVKVIPLGRENMGPKSEAVSIIVR